MKIPSAVIVVISETLAAHHTHSALNKLFARIGAPGEPPEGNKEEKCRTWFERMNDDPNADSVAFLGRILQDYMDYEIPESNFNIYEWQQARGRINRVLSKNGLRYDYGGRIAARGTGTSFASLQNVIREKNLPEIDALMFETFEKIDGKPADALTSACCTLESLFKIYIEDEQLPPPSKKTVKPLWDAVSKHLGFDPAIMPEDDLKKILSGLTSIVDGLGSIRTHAGSAHGHGRSRYRVAPRHARLAVNAAHTLATFVIETWDTRRAKKTSR